MVATTLPIQTLEVMHKLTSLVLKIFVSSYNSLELTTEGLVGNFGRKLTPAGR